MKILTCIYFFILRTIYITKIFYVVIIMIKFIFLSLAVLALLSGCTTGATPGTPTPDNRVPMQEQPPQDDTRILEQERDKDLGETTRERLDEVIPDIDTRLPRTDDVDTPMPRTDDLQTPTMPGVDMDRHSPGTDVDTSPLSDRVR